MIRRALTLALLLVLIPATADAAVTSKKAIWGPTEFEAESLFPTYKALGAGIYQMKLEWDKVAELEPLEAKDPLDASYEWPDQIDTAISEARANGIQVALTVTGTPDWAEARRSGRATPPSSPPPPGATRRCTCGRSETAAKSSAARALRPPARRRLRRAEGAQPRNRVVGGNSTGNGAARWIRSLKLANGKAPRMDFYGHSTTRAADRRRRRGARRRRRQAPVPDLSLTAGATQSSRLRSALRVARRSSDVYSLAYRGLYDEEPTRTGLIDSTDNTKRSAYTAFKNG